MKRSTFGSVGQRSRSHKAEIGQTVDVMFEQEVKVI